MLKVRVVEQVGIPLQNTYLRECFAAVCSGGSFPWPRFLGRAGEASDPEPELEPMIFAIEVLRLGSAVAWAGLGGSLIRNVRPPPGDAVGVAELSACDFAFCCCFSSALRFLRSSS